MKPYKRTVLSVLLVVFSSSLIAQAQGARGGAVQPGGPQNPDLVGEIRLIVGPLQFAGQREGDDRNRVRAQGDVLHLSTASGGINVRIQDPNNLQLAGAWWTNPTVVERLGLTDDQKTKVARAFENHRDNIVSSTGLLEKEEAQLARLLEAEPLDRNNILIQIDRVVQARGEVERVNSAMTLEMRESLTRAQWLLLPSVAPRVWIDGINWVTGKGGGRGPAPVPAPQSQPGARGRGGRGQQ